MNKNSNTNSKSTTSSGLPPMESRLPSPPSVHADPAWRVPDEAECEALWNEYGMLDNIKAHSRLVAHIATCIAEKAVAAGLDVHLPTVKASALLHDIAKTYTIRHGGNHSQIGAAWAMRITGNPAIAMGVLHHVYWPFELDVEKYFLPIVVSYSDKRVMHDNLTSLEVRFSDLQVRYGSTDYIRGRIKKTMDQALLMEEKLNTLLGADLNACSFDSGRLV